MARPPAAKKGLFGTIWGDIKQGASTVGKDLFGGGISVPRGSSSGSGGLILPQTSSGVPQVPGYQDYSNASSLQLPSGSAASQISQGQNPYSNGYNVQGLSGQSNISQSAPANAPTSTPIPSGAPLPQASPQDVTSALQMLSAQYLQYQASHPGATSLTDPYLQSLHTQAQDIRNQNPGVGPAQGYTPQQLQKAGLLPSSPSNVTPAAASPSQTNFNPQTTAAAPLAQGQNLPNGAGGTGISVGGMSGPTTLLQTPSGVMQTPTPGRYVAPQPSTVPQVPSAAPKSPTVPGLAPASSTGLPRPSAGLPTFTPTTYGQPAGVPQSPTGTPSGVPTQTSTPPPLKLGGPAAPSQGPTGQTNYQQTPQTPQQAQQTMQSGLSDLNSVASQLKAAAPDVQALGLSFLTQYLQQLDATENAWKSQLQAEQKGVDPATQAAIDQLKQDAELQRQQLMDQMNARGLLQSGIVLEMQDRANRNELTQEQQLLGNSLSKILNQLNSGLLSFAQMRMGAIQNIGSQTMQGMVSQGMQDQRNLLQLAGMQQSQNQFNQDFNLRQGEALGQINGQPTIQAQQMQFNQGMNTAKFLTDSTGVMYGTNGQPIVGPDGQPLTTLKYQQLQNSQNNADRNYLLNLWKTSGVAPQGISGVQAGQPSEQAIVAEQRAQQAAASAANVADSRQITQLMQVWRDSGQAPDGLQFLGVQPGTAYYSASTTTGGAQTTDVQATIQQAVSMGMSAQDIHNNLAALGYDPTQYGY